MSDQSGRGRRVQIYLPADLLERWEDIPRYERSKIVAAALRMFWGIGAEDISQSKNSQIDSQTDQKVDEQGEDT